VCVHAYMYANMYIPSMEAHAISDTHQHFLLKFFLRRDALIESLFKNALQQSTYLCFVSDFKINIIICESESNRTKGSENVCMYVNMYICIYSRLQIGWPKILILFPRTFNLVPRRTRNLIGFIISTTSLPGTNRKSHGQNFGW